MIRIHAGDHWKLIGHQDHARLAGAFADRWGNADFSKPEPFFGIREAVSRHDDAWAERDAEPLLTPAGEPSAFSRELVGTYDAFEEIDFADYLKVRGRATEGVAADNPYAAILVSMHTVNLLTEQADLSSLDEADQRLHAEFIDHQMRRQEELRQSLASRPALGRFLSDECLSAGFRFLQACDSLSLIACVGYDSPLPLRHQHPTRQGLPVSIICHPLRPDVYQCAPYPFDEPLLRFEIPFRRVGLKACDSIESFQQAYREAEVEFFPLVLTADHDAA
jgi:hypothetical protein